MRTLAFTATGAERFNDWAAMCCSCGLCTLFACPEELYPKEACDQSKAELRKGNIKYAGPTTVEVHPMRDGRRVPIKSLMERLHIAQYDDPAHWQAKEISAKRLVLPLKQSAGAPSVAIVKAGDRVNAGQQLTEIAEKALGARIHTPVAGVIAEVTAQLIIIERN
jgi:Na+-translocating ferredoxin:NAD+ oxidoreductase RnfC subunit